MLAKVKPGGGAGLFDAIYMACQRRHVIAGEPFDPRRVLIIIGDGHDTASKRSLEEVLEIAQRNLGTIYGMSTGAFCFHSGREKKIIPPAGENGGAVQESHPGVYSHRIRVFSSPALA